MFALITIGLATILFWLLYNVSTKNFDYWKKKKVPYAKPLPLFGNYAGHIQMRQSMGLINQKLCKQFRDQPYFGTFYGTDPALVVLDPEIIKLIMVKDFYYFSSREGMDHNDCEATTQNMFFTQGNKWRIMRQNFTPFFTNARMKNMFHLIEKSAHMLEETMDQEIKTSDVVGTKALMIRYTMDAICACAFGVDANTLSKNIKGNPFMLIGQLIFSSSYYRAMKLYGRALWPKIFYALGFQCFPEDIEMFFSNLLTGVFENRNYKPSPRSDFVDLVLNMKTNQKHIIGDSINNLKTGNEEKIKLELTNELLVSQCMVFFAAGFETSATALGLTLYELAKNPKAQKRAQDEIDEYLKKNKNKLTYECLKELPYLNACMAETTRIYPVLGFITREVVEDYTFPSGLQLERGARVHLPIYYFHHNPDYFPDPESYKPERFLPEAEHEIKPCTFLPFGEGPRHCIGQ